MSDNIIPCEYCENLTSFERHSNDEPEEGQRCDQCGNWVCNDCLDWGKSGERNICKYCSEDRE